MDKISNNKIIKDLTKSNISTFDVVYDTYSKSIYLFALRFLKSEIEAEEVVQNTFTKLWENRKCLKKNNSLKSYLFTIAYNSICDHFRFQNHKRTLHNDYSYRHTDSVDLDNTMDCRSTLERVDQLIGNLPSKHKEVFIKSRKEFKSTKEIALEMDLSPGTVDNYISYALRYLKKHIK